MAQRIAVRLKGTSSGAPSTVPTPVSAGSAANSEQSAKPSGLPPSGSRPDGPSGMGRPGGGGGSPQLQQAISRIPPPTLPGLQKGEPRMVVATWGAPNRLPTLNTLLAWG